MSTGSGWAATLAEQVRARLAVLDLQAAGVLRRAVDVVEVRAQLRGLIGAWRRLLAAHYPADGESRCPRCRSWWGGRRRWPCPVWRIAHTNLAIHQVPAPDGVAAAAAWVRAASSARHRGARLFPVSRQSPAVRIASRVDGTPGAVGPDPTSSPVGAAAPGTSHQRRSQSAQPTSSMGLGAEEAGRVVEQVVVARRAREVDAGGVGRGAAGW